MDAQLVVAYLWDVVSRRTLEIRNEAFSDLSIDMTSTRTSPFELVLFSISPTSLCCNNRRDVDMMEELGQFQDVDMARSAMPDASCVP